MLGIHGRLRDPADLREPGKDKPHLSGGRGRPGRWPARAFWRITFPLSLPGVVAAFIMMFVPTMGGIHHALMVGGPDNMLIGNWCRQCSGR